VCMCVQAALRPAWLRSRGWGCWGAASSDPLPAAASGSVPTPQARGHNGAGSAPDPHPHRTPSPGRFYPPPAGKQACSVTHRALSMGLETIRIEHQACPCNHRTLSRNGRGPSHASKYAGHSKGLTCAMRAGL